MQMQVRTTMWCVSHEAEIGRGYYCRRAEAMYQAGVPISPPCTMERVALIPTSAIKLHGPSYLFILDEYTSWHITESRVVATPPEVNNV
jgi:hypothetical protein